MLLQFAGIELLAPNCSIALLRSDGDGQQQKEAYNYARHLGENLFQGGLFPAVLEEEAATPACCIHISFYCYPCRGRLAGTAEGAQPVCAKPRQTQGFHALRRFGG